jgi:hypothetical protein
MELTLYRSYFPTGTNGAIYLGVLKICNSIELPWVGNKRQVSCIPEGRYRLEQRSNPKFGWHLHLPDVAGREAILVHPANNALLELRGCIAPVTVLTHVGKGTGSRNAMGRIRLVTSKAFADGDPIFLNIKKYGHENF